MAEVEHPAIDVMDDTFIVAPVAELARRFRDPGLWKAWWPRLTLSVAEDRGLRGVRWSVAGDVTGTAEIWLEPWRDGVVVHWLLRADPARRRLRFPRPRVGGDRRIRQRYVRSFKHHVHGLKDELEHGRAVGCPRQANRPVE